MSKDREESSVVDVFDLLPRWHYEKAKVTLEEQLSYQHIDPETRKLFIAEIRRIDEILERL